MRAEDYTPRGAKVKLSDNPNFKPYRGTVTPSFSITREQAAFIKKMGGSKFVRELVDKAMGVNNG
ncbi:hypothetical protein CR151_05655 [Vibrio cholerae]|uniref:hypothetical protein n=1 Tax=Vibrio cholerae TaxID=666 RepID=UPI000C7F3185|nr:hypothetical protein [Vibrio cholerae]PKQ54379.1 hypothetical protein CR151_05655 [Vibrio cholerae]